MNASFSKHSAKPAVNNAPPKPPTSRRLASSAPAHVAEEPATSQLLTDLAQALANETEQEGTLGQNEQSQASERHEHLAGVPTSPEVLVLASSRRGLPRRETRRNVRIARLGPTRRDSASLLSRTLARHARRGDTVVLLTDPPLLGLFATPILRLRRARIIHWVQDIYPEIAAELSGQRWLCALRPLRDWSWRNAHATVTLGPDMVAVLTAARVSPKRIHTIPNWPLPELHEAPLADITALKATWPEALADKFVVLYSGNLGRVHDLPPILEIAASLRDTAPHIAFIFVGRGAQQAPLRAAAHARALTNIHFLPPAPRAQLSASLSAGDLHLVTLKPGCERYVLPSKLYGITAVSRPLLFIGPRTCALFKDVADTGIGLSFARDETAAAANAIRALADSPEQRQRMQTAARQFSQAHNFATSLHAWRKLLAQSGPSPKPNT